jgi:DNA-directed RNA polymerase specialized sigma24 family protein
MDVETYLIARESVNRLRREVCRLKPDLRRVVEIRESKDATLQEIASLAGYRCCRNEVSLVAGPKDSAKRMG